MQGWLDHGIYYVLCQVYKQSSRGGASARTADGRDAGGSGVSSVKAKAHRTPFSSDVSADRLCSILIYLASMFCVLCVLCSVFYIRLSSCAVHAEPSGRKGRREWRGGHTEKNGARE